MKIKEILFTLVLVTAGAGSLPAENASKSVEITGNDSMKFSVTSFTVKPGEIVNVELKNEGTLPKAVMGHNWVLLKAGNDGSAYSVAAAPAKDEGYQPKALANEVIAAIGLLGPKETGHVTFTAPTAPGDYVYLCSYPAHFQVGMRGVMTVK